MACQIRHIHAWIFRKTCFAANSSSSYDECLFPYQTRRSGTTSIHACISCFECGAESCDLHGHFFRESLVEISCKLNAACSSCTRRYIGIVGPFTAKSDKLYPCLYCACIARLFRRIRIASVPGTYSCARVAAWRYACGLSFTSRVIIYCLEKCLGSSKAGQRVRLPSTAHCACLAMHGPQ